MTRLADGQATVTGRAAITYTYGNANQLTLISQGSSNTAFAYDPAGRRSTLTLPNGVTVTYSYDQSSQLTGITYQYAGTDLGNLSYSNDLAGRRSGVTGSFARTGVPSLLSSATMMPQTGLRSGAKPRSTTTPMETRSTTVSILIRGTLRIGPWP